LAGLEVTFTLLNRVAAVAAQVSLSPDWPFSRLTRFAAELPNECWQADFTHYRLAGGIDTEILSWLDDHSRLALRVTA